MRRLLLLGGLLLPLPTVAQAQDAFCNGLRRVVQSAADGFMEMPEGDRLIPGTTQQWRGTLEDADGPARGAVFMLLDLDPARRAAATVDVHFRRYAEEIGRCLPDAQASGVMPAQRGAIAMWQNGQARVRLRRDDGDGGASSAQLELAVASRW